MKKPSVAIFFDKRRMKEGHASVKLSVYFSAHQKQYATGVILDQKQLEFLTKNKAGLSGKVRDEELRNLWNKVYGREFADEVTGEPKETWLFKAQKILSRIEHRFSFEEFQALLFSESQEESLLPNDLITALKNQAASFVKDNNHTRATIFRSAAKSVERFVSEAGITKRSSPKVPFGIVTKEFLKKYEKFLLTNGGIQHITKARKPVSTTTVSYYMSSVKKIVNEAVKAKIIDREDYPFGPDGYRIPKGQNTKKALPSEVLTSLLNYSGKYPRRNYALAVWKFSYFCGGMNMADLARLKWRNIDLINNQVIFIRRKTRNSTANPGKETVAALMPEASHILATWCQTSSDPNDFVFPVLRQDMDGEQIHKAIYNLTHQVNRMLATILEELGIQAKIRTYEARHSYATTLSRAQVPLAFISQGLGHSSLKTTEQYLGSFEYDQTQQFLSALIPKKQESQDS